MVTSLDKLYDVGTFVQIYELHDTGNQMRMIIQGHRRWVEGREGGRETGRQTDRQIGRWTDR